MKIIKSQLKKIIKEEISNLALEAETMSIDPRDVDRAKADRLATLRKQTHGREGNLTDVDFVEGIGKILGQGSGNRQEYADKIAKQLGFDYNKYWSPYDRTKPLEKVGDNPPDRSGFWERFNDEEKRLGKKFPYAVIDTSSWDVSDGSDPYIICDVADASCDADEGTELDEEKKDDFLGDVKSTGEWTDITIAQLKKKIAAANKKQEKYKKKHDGKAKKSITKLLRQMNFSKNAKEGDYK